MEKARASTMRGLGVLAMAILAGCSSPSAVGDGGIFVPAAHRTIPPLARNSGAMSTPLTLVTITAVNDALAPVLQDFGDALIQSQWLRTVGAPYALPTPAASIHVADQPAIGGAMSSIDIVTYLQNVIARTPVHSVTPASWGTILRFLRRRAVKGTATPSSPGERSRARRPIVTSSHRRRVTRFWRPPPIRLIAAGASGRLRRRPGP
jgi:hypothetical protein